MNKFRTQNGQFDKREIMVAAWKLYRDLKRDWKGCTFGYCLRAIWKKAKAAPVSAEQAAVKLELIQIETKSRMTNTDYARIHDLRAKLAA